MWVLLATAVSIAFFHTLMGPDHYLPFIMISKARGWSLPRTLSVTFLCGVGHVMSSVIIGLAGIALGIALHKIELVESMRGNIAAYLLIAFGLLYFLWGLRQAYLKKPHSHLHFHADGQVHEHRHVHTHHHAHVHDQEQKSITPWVLFLIFVFGPCEPLIPILMYPAAQSHWFDLMVVTTGFGLVTISTMLVIVFFAIKGIDLLPTEKIERYTHALAGFVILACGLAIQFLGL